MWLLNTDTATLKYFNSPEDVQGGYAILSHCWDQHRAEQTFQEIVAIKQRAELLRLNPRRFVSPKIRDFCKLAAAHGYRWAWVDTCCIDKTSSTELSEAINSMFRYYALSQACYVYLSDVSSKCDLGSESSEFWESRWYRRGWTLQELIAPRFLVFLARDWTVLGTKVELAPVVEKITSIPASVLKFEQDLAEVSVARRMSWAGTRWTTRVEDEAYCLMGIFGVNMPVLYGEGSNAFYRLQEEVMRSLTDSTLFLWGTYAPSTTASTLSSMAPTLSPPTGESRSTSIIPFLFAPAPSDFSIACNFDGATKAVNVRAFLGHPLANNELTWSYPVPPSE
ncbi:HET-domain-containing protein [Epithele typhae]|uniref:HET-domain-containing protein n=1 Tax=Epithele typhae TaxID=378194 RepID=UPI00200763D7|nr:HET-domain-containing protein [Epithele typhae]KAH9935226.1 HET-domain-containing protein [Epithele typhae]